MSSDMGSVPDLIQIAAATVFVVVLHVRLNDNNNTVPVICAWNVELKVVDKFCYLGSILSNDTNIDDDISAPLGKALADCRNVCGAYTASPLKQR